MAHRYGPAVMPGPGAYLHMSRSVLCADELAQEEEAYAESLKAICQYAADSVPLGLVGASRAGAGHAPPHRVPAASHQQHDASPSTTSSPSFDRDGDSTASDSSSLMESLSDSSSWDFM